MKFSFLPSVGFVPSSSCSSSCGRSIIKSEGRSAQATCNTGCAIVGVPRGESVGGANFRSERPWKVGLGTPLRGGAIFALSNAGNCNPIRPHEVRRLFISCHTDAGQLPRKAGTHRRKPLEWRRSLGPPVVEYGGGAGRVRPAVQLHVHLVRHREARACACAVCLLSPSDNAGLHWISHVCSFGNTARMLVRMLSHDAGAGCTGTRHLRGCNRTLDAG